MKVFVEQITVRFTQEEASVISCFMLNAARLDPMGAVSDILQMDINRVVSICDTFHEELQKRLDTSR